MLRLEMTGNSLSAESESDDAAETVDEEGGSKDHDHSFRVSEVGGVKDESDDCESGQNAADERPDEEPDLREGFVLLAEEDVCCAFMSTTGCAIDEDIL